MLLSASLQIGGYPKSSYRGGLKLVVINSKEYLDRVSKYYLLDKNNNKIFLSEFLHLIYLDQNKDEWHMHGDEKYIDE